MAGAVKWNEAVSYEPLAGEFEATFMGLKYNVKGKSSDNPNAEFNFTLTDPEVEGRKVRAWKGLGESAMWSAKEWLVALGADPEDVEKPMEDIEAYANEFIGNSVRLRLSVGTNPNTGRPSQNIDSVRGQYDL